MNLTRRHFLTIAATCVSPYSGHATPPASTYAKRVLEKKTCGY